MMEFNGKTYETIDDIAKRSGYTVDKIRPLEGRVKAFVFNNKQYYEPGYEPSQHEAINKGQGKGEERLISRVIVVPDNGTGAWIKDYFKRKGFNPVIREYSNRYVTYKKHYVEIWLNNRKRSEFKELTDIPKLLGKKWITHWMSYVFDNKEDYEIFKGKGKNTPDAVYIDRMEVTNK